MADPCTTPDVHCFGCGETVDLRRDAARVLGGKVVRLCRRCAGQGDSLDDSSSSPPARARTICSCGAEVDLRDATPRIGARGVSLLCPRCVDPGARELPAPRPPALEPPRRRRVAPGKLVLAGLGAGAAVAAALALGWSEKSAQATTALHPTAPAEVAIERRLLGVDLLEVVWSDPAPVAGPEPPPEERVDPGIPGAEGWVHPLPETDEPIPDRDSRRFGATRPGDRPSECRAGHCGVDLGAAPGTPVLAVVRGVVQSLVSDTGGRSGKYVHLLHPGGVETFYMHLDEILPGIERGTIVEAGQMLGIAGSTGISSSAPHLHFAVTIPGRFGGRRYVDPEAALGQARVISLLEVAVAGNRK